MLRSLSNRRFWLLLAALVAVCAYPGMYVCLHNVAEADFAEVLPPTLAFLAGGLAAWLCFRILSGTMAKGAFPALVFVFVFTNYAQIDEAIRMLLPAWRWWRIAPALLFLLINLALALRVWDPLRKGDAACFRLTLAIGALCLVATGFHAARAGMVLARAPRPEAPPVPAGSPPAAVPTPRDPAAPRSNFYFFIFDEYARQDVLEKYTGYDNTPFLRRLESMGFNVGYAGHAVSSKTRACLANLLNLAPEYKNLQDAPATIPRPPLLTAFRNAGYQIHLTLYVDYQINADLVDTRLTTRTVLTAMSAGQTVREASFLAYLRPAGNQDKRADALGLFRQAADIAAAPDREPKFLLVHFMLPHEPFIFDENGNSVAYENMHNWLDPEFYTGQLRFTSEKIIELVRPILEKDPGAVVLIQSDHGARDFGGRQTDEEKQACLNALYLSGQPRDIRGLSTVETLRVAVNAALQLDLPPERD